MSDNKTEKPTPRRRQKAREQGQVARSRDLSGTLAVSGVVGLIAWQGYSGIEAWRNLLRHTFEFSSGDPLTPAAPLLIWTGWTVARCAAPVMAVAWTLALLGGVAQGGLVFAPEALAQPLEVGAPEAQIGRQRLGHHRAAQRVDRVHPLHRLVVDGFALLRGEGRLARGGCGCGRARVLARGRLAGHEREREAQASEPASGIHSAGIARPGAPRPALVVRSRGSRAGRRSGATPRAWRWVAVRS